MNCKFCLDAETIVYGRLPALLWTDNQKYRLSLYRRTVSDRDASLIKGPSSDVLLFLAIKKYPSNVATVMQYYIPNQTFRAANRADCNSPIISMYETSVGEAHWLSVFDTKMVEPEI